MEDVTRYLIIHMLIENLQHNDQCYDGQHEAQVFSWA